MNVYLPDVSDLTTWPQVAFILIGLSMWLAVTIFTVIAIIKSSNLPPPLLLVISLTSVVLICIAAYVVTGLKDLATLAGLGLGALAGAVSATWPYTRTQSQEDKRDKRDEEPPDPDVR